jgi:hypothetical protein
MIDKEHEVRDWIIIVSISVLVLAVLLLSFLS